jgi:hypothetical protein
MARMTINGAEIAARARWGKHSAVQYYTVGRLAGTKMVGFISLGCFFEVKGQGKTWEEAFADADRKAEIDRARIAAIKGKRKTA